MLEARIGHEIGSRIFISSPYPNAGDALFWPRLFVSRMKSDREDMTRNPEYLLVLSQSSLTAQDDGAMNDQDDQHNTVRTWIRSTMLTLATAEPQKGKRRERSGLTV